MTFLSKSSNSAYRRKALNCHIRMEYRCQNTPWKSCSKGCTMLQGRIFFKIISTIWEQRYATKAVNSYRYYFTFLVLDLVESYGRHTPELKVGESNLNL